MCSPKPGSAGPNFGGRAAGIAGGRGRTISYGCQNYRFMERANCLTGELQQLDRVEPGREFEVERLDRGDYRLTRVTGSNEGAIDCLLACPHKGFLCRSTLSRSIPCENLVDANVLTEPTKPSPDSRAIGWVRAHESQPPSWLVCFSARPR